MSIQEIQNEIIDEFAMFDDWEERYQYMIDLGKSLPIIKDEFKTNDKKEKDKKEKQKELDIETDDSE